MIEGGEKDVFYKKNTRAITREDRISAQKAWERAWDWEGLLEKTTDPALLEVNYGVNNESLWGIGITKDGQWLITVDPNDALFIRTASGALKPYPLERVFIHELGHFPMGGTGPASPQSSAIWFENSWAKQHGHPLRENR